MTLPLPEEDLAARQAAQTSTGTAGQSPSAPAAPPGSGTSGTTSGPTGDAVFSVPPNMQIWLIDGAHWLVRAVPGLEPPVHVGWQIPEGTDLQSMVGIGADANIAQTLTQRQANAIGFLDFGSTTELANYGGTDPLIAWEENYATEAQVRPWLLNPEIMALSWGALLEGRSVTEAELATTRWWQNHNDAQRAWLTLNLSNPATAEQQRQDARINTRAVMESAGIADAPVQLVNWMADQVTRGNWTNTYLQLQIRNLADPTLRSQIDDRLKTFIAKKDFTVDATRDREQQIRDLALQWLGPVYGKLTDDQIQRYAHDLRSDPDALDRIRDQFAQQRLAMFPTYTNPLATYEDIAGPWRNVWSNVLGETADETDALFTDVVNTNNLGEAQKLLYRAGYERGNKRVVDAIATDMTRSFGDLSVRTPI